MQCLDIASGLSLYKIHCLSFAVINHHFVGAIGTLCSGGSRGSQFFRFDVQILRNVAVSEVDAHPMGNPGLTTALFLDLG